MARRKRVQVGWYCDHETERGPCFGDSSHMSPHGKWKGGKWIETYPEPSTTRSLTFLDHKNPKKKPPCPLAVPLYVYAEATS